MRSQVLAALAAHQETFERLRSEGIDGIMEVGTLLGETLHRGDKILVAGNGGSASDAQHMVAELVGRYLKERGALPAIALTTDTSILTAVGNDYGFDQVFSRQVEGLGRQGDVLLVISTSGNSGNLIRAVESARAQKMVTVGLLGKDGGRLKEMVDHPIVVPSQETPRIQEAHLWIYHTWCEMIDEQAG